jgi:hypothetical protein
MTHSDAARSRLVSTTVALALALAAGWGAARADDGAPPDPYTPCDGRKTGAACTATRGAHTVQGTCASAPDGRLACRPDAPRPPAEAFTACNAKGSGDACSVTAGPLTVSGTCAAADDGRLACRPSGPPPPPLPR